MPLDTQQPATTFISHGSSKKEYFDFVTNLIKEIAGDRCVNVGFLDMLQPDIQTAIEVHIKNGATTIRLLPLFLGPGKHISTDIPHIVDEVQKRHPHVTLILENFLANHKGYGELLKKWVNCG